MSHFSVDGQPLSITYTRPNTKDEIRAAASNITDVCIVILPPSEPANYAQPLQGIGELIGTLSSTLGENATLVTIGEVIDLVQVQAEMPDNIRHQHWIAIKRSKPIAGNSRRLPHLHFGALVHTRYGASLKHTKTRIAYTYCPVCDKTTKDYGGKKHTYHESGTLISDVWRDISSDLAGDLGPVISRFSDLLGIEMYSTLHVIDARSSNLVREPFARGLIEDLENVVPADVVNRIVQGDCLEKLKELPSNSVDFAFIDPPYNLKKKYLGYADDMGIQEYFNWCDEWIDEIFRVLKPGRTLALLNIPLWSVRHFLHMQEIAEYQNWIVWDALAFPVRMIMPAHYSILCFSKGEARDMPGLTGESTHISVASAPKTFHSLLPLADDYCLRANCVDTRIAAKINDKTLLADLWSDIHRLKHNSRRVDHPCQLPPHLMYRIITAFTKPGEVVLDCFNGAGTSTLAAHQLGRRYIGIEASEKYCQIAEERHWEIDNGIDPFRKEDRILTSKNSPVRRLAKQTYKVPKKTLQLEVKRVARQLGHIPTREELIQHGKFPIEYYDNYFVSWGEVTAAARTTGMQEQRSGSTTPDPEVESMVQLRLLESRKRY